MFLPFLHVQRRKSLDTEAANDCSAAHALPVLSRRLWGWRGSIGDNGIGLEDMKDVG